MSSIADIQDKEEERVLQKYETTGKVPEEAVDVEQRESAARAIQRTFRGHRERRHLRGLSLDPTSRWTEVIVKSNIHLRNAANINVVGDQRGSVS